jgi:hypothetical protein
MEQFNYDEAADPVVEVAQPEVATSIGSVVNSEQEEKQRILERTKRLEHEAETFFAALEKPDADLIQIKDDFKSLSLNIDNLRTSLPESSDGLPAERLESLSRQAYARTNTFILAVFANGMKVPLRELSEGDSAEIERSANYAGDKTALLLRRISNPNIHNQLSRLLLLDNNCDLYAEKTFSAEDVSRNLSETLALVSKDTPITFSGEAPSANRGEGMRENMDILWQSPKAFGQYGVEQKNYTEAHEKGHTLRKVQSLAAKKYIEKGFNFGRLFTSISQEGVSRLVEYCKSLDPESADSITNMDAIIGLVQYLSDPVEIIERMSQLKNYFGMTGDEVFTREHLRYAREHYIKDTKLDNFMQEFFLSITPETEDAFLVLINTCGI